eukprot:11839500-Ditylum_brightwellii.AAC.1
MELLAVDREIDAAAAAKKGTKPAELSGAYTQLNDVNHQISHGRMAKKCYDNMSVLMEIIATDKLMDRLYKGEHAL